MIAQKTTTRKCRNKACHVRFPITEQKPFAVACSIECEIVLAKQYFNKLQVSRAKKERADIKVRKESLRNRGWYEKKLEGICNHIARLRDAEDPCISCIRFHQGQYHGGHYLSVGAHPRLRFDLRNINKQCQPCNVALSGNHHFYRIGMLKKYGCETVQELECHEATDSYQKPTIDELKSLIVERGAMLKQLLKAQA